MAFRITFAYPPGSNRLWRNLRGRMVVSEAASAWKKTAAWQARAQGCLLLEGQAIVDLILHPKLTKAGRASATRLDVDAPIKLTLDALQGVAYTDDKQVVAVSCRVGDPQPGGGLTLRVWGVGEEAP